MGTPQKKYHVTDDGKIYRIADNGEVTEVGDVSEVDREGKRPAPRAHRPTKPKTAASRPRPKREKTEDGNSYGCLFLILIVIGILAFIALN